MGLYDRDYGRFESDTPWDRAQRSSRSITITLIVINVAVFFIDMIFASRDGGGQSQSILVPWFAASSQTITHPWLIWQSLTYGFMHDTQGIQHILFNMIGLFFFGRAVEQRIGGQEFLRFYLIAIVIGGIVGALTFLAQGLGPGGTVVGASGAVIATTILFACYYPHSEILLMFVIPVKAWVVAVLFVGADLYGALTYVPGSGGTAFTVHLSGAAFALLYYFRRWNLRWLDLGFFAEIPDRLSQRSRRMKLKLHDPDKKMAKEAEEADRILAKIHETGESSLTSAERKTLERYSRRQARKAKPLTPWSPNRSAGSYAIHRSAERSGDHIHNPPRDFPMRLTELLRSCALLSCALCVSFCPLRALAADSTTDTKRPEVGDKAPDFDLPIVGSQEEDYLQLDEEVDQGAVVVVVLRGYPGYQCPLCSRQVGGLINRAKALAEVSHRVILVYPGEPDLLQRHADEFIGSRAVPEPLVMVRDPGMKMVTQWGLRWDAPRETAYPATYVIKKNGRIAWSKISDSHAGRTTADEIINELRKLK